MPTVVYDEDEFVELVLDDEDEELAMTALC